VHDKCLKEALAKKTLVRLHCDACKNEDRYQKIQSRPFYKYRWLMGILFILAVSLGPQTVARFTVPERVAVMGWFQLIVFSWIISFMVLMGVAIFVILLTCVVKPARFIRDTLMPEQVTYINTSAN
jgi:hypothetical protein